MGPDGELQFLCTRGTLAFAFNLSFSRDNHVSSLLTDEEQKRVASGRICNVSSARRDQVSSSDSGATQLRISK